MTSLQRKTNGRCCSVLLKLLRVKEKRKGMVSTRSQRKELVKSELAVQNATLKKKEGTAVKTLRVVLSTKAKEVEKTSTQKTKEKEKQINQVLQSKTDKQKKSKVQKNSAAKKIRVLTEFVTRKAKKQKCLDQRLTLVENLKGQMMDLSGNLLMAKHSASDAAFVCEMAMKQRNFSPLNLMKRLMHKIKKLKIFFQQTKNCGIGFQT